jgi:hypothetical protein
MLCYGEVSEASSLRATSVRVRASTVQHIDTRSSCSAGQRSSVAGATLGLPRASGMRSSCAAPPARSARATTTDDRATVPE